jgi:hypothetical protein
MRLKDVTGRFDSGNKFYKGKYKKFECCINYSSNDNIWYYHIDSNDERDIRYNSLWNGIKFKTQEDCIKDCQKYIDEVLKNAKISKKMG